MKKLIISGFVLLIASTGIFAQKELANQNLSRKELMKVRVTKINADQTGNGRYGTGTLNQNRSQKELMKKKLVKHAPLSPGGELAGNSAKCASCIALLKLSPKEKMKTQAMGIYKCPMPSEDANSEFSRCPVCGMAMAMAMSNKNKNE